MTLDISEAIALAKDLLETSSDFRPHDPEMADQFSSRAFEICDDLGIDPALIGVQLQPNDLQDDGSNDVDDDDTESAIVEMTSAETVDDEARQTSDELRDLLQQQALVLQNARQTHDLEPPKAARRSFRLFGRSDNRSVGRLLQSASA
ncbi:MAG: hypothetical protein ACR2RF_10800 [Geminicoccaceae bacterium]